MSAATSRATSSRAPGAEAKPEGVSGTAASSRGSTRTRSGAPSGAPASRGARLGGAARTVR